MEPEPLTVKDYLEACSTASSHTRTMVIALLVGSILALASVRHTMEARWMHERLKQLRDPAGPYVTRELGEAPPPPGSDPLERARYMRRYEQLSNALTTADVESFLVRVPFVGFTFDVNDLGLFAAAGFTILMTLYRFYLAREYDNLKLAFSEAAHVSDEELESFYKLISMRQVFTVPKSDSGTPTRFRKAITSAITWLPLPVLIYVSADDLTTTNIGTVLNHSATLTVLLAEALGIACIAWLALRISLRHSALDALWDKAWSDIVSGRNERSESGRSYLAK